MHPFVIPHMSLPSQYLKELGKSEFRLLMSHFEKPLNNWLIAILVRLIAIDGARQSNCLTGAALTQTMVLPQHLNNFAFLLRL